MNSAGNIREYVVQALAEVTGNRSFADRSFLKRDLGLTSIDLIDVFFEIERLAKTRLDARQLFQAFSSGAAEGRDICLQDLVVYLEGLTQEK